MKDKVLVITGASAGIGGHRRGIGAELADVVPRATRSSSNRSRSGAHAS